MSTPWEDPGSFAAERGTTPFAEGLPEVPADESSGHPGFRVEKPRGQSVAAATEPQKDAATFDDMPQRPERDSVYSPSAPELPGLDFEFDPISPISSHPLDRDPDIVSTAPSTGDPFGAEGLPSLDFESPSHESASHQSASHHFSSLDLPSLESASLPSAASLDELAGERGRSRHRPELELEPPLPDLSPSRSEVSPPASDEALLDLLDPSLDSPSASAMTGASPNRSIERPPQAGSHAAGIKVESIPSPPMAPDATLATRTAGRGATEGHTMGIDLGTSNVCAATMVNGEVKIIPTRYNTISTPSVYSRIGGRVLVGDAAVKRMVLDPRSTVYGSKRLIGRAYTPELAADYQPYFAYPLVETHEHRFGAELNREIVSFEEVAAAFLREMAENAKKFLEGPIDRTVITVPAYFSDAQREAVRRAARGAGLMVEQLVSEPTAAALAYGHGRSGGGTFVVFDVGGGTFDVSILNVHHGDFKVLATGGDPFLGGLDVDDMVANYLLEELHRETRERLEPSPQQLARLREVAEECKRGLSVQETFAVHLNHFLTVDEEPVDLSATVSRKTLERLAEPFVDRLLDIAAETVSAAGLSAKDIDEVLLVGGMSRMPLVQERVESFFGRRCNRRVNPDEAVARGAALLASRIREVNLADVLPLSIGIAGPGRTFLRLLPRNTPIPAQRDFVVRPDPGPVYELPLFQGERRDAAENEYLGTLVIAGLASGAEERGIDLTLTLDHQAMLGLVARDGLTGAGLSVSIKRDRSATHVREAQEEYSGPAEAEPERLGSALGRFFSRVRGFLRSSR